MIDRCKTKQKPVSHSMFQNKHKSPSKVPKGHTFENKHINHLRFQSRHKSTSKVPKGHKFQKDIGQSFKVPI
ncbi:unnamed protein product [Acanthoscelides obtectus]|uniref:Uncharacterized protein n=1 Tax=Acanthoscelides obtectus TaxID=200917 RepID=A0A9P0QEB1_ACAOB|nr:unnamed protein product [Acanthoscelides obtectus]CAK1675881.1 hypothetical protein AOBTE_LOCUS30462 [Acanthoscelides obtectus]